MKIENLAATQLYGAARKATAIPTQEQGSGFTEALENALTEMRASVERGEHAAKAAMTGEGDPVPRLDGE